MDDETSTPNPSIANTANLTAGLEPAATFWLPPAIIPYETFDILQTIIIGINQSASLMGVANNVINIVVFVKLGLRETTSISMMSLAMSDLLVCVLSLWSNLLYFPPFIKLPLSFRPEEIFLITGGTSRIFVARASALITTYIAIERCLCVITPLKVRTSITRRRTIIVMVCIFVINLGSSCFLWGNYRFAHRYYPDVNRTLLGIRYVDGVVNNIVDRVISTVILVFPLIATFCTICITTVFLVVHLLRTSKWRKSHSNTGNEKQKQIANNTHAQGSGCGGGGQTSSSEKQSSKEDRVARTVVVISFVFIVCFVTNTVTTLLYVFMPGFSMYGKYSQMFTFLHTIGYTTESINCSVNLFIYYNMGTNFRNMVLQIFKCQEKQDKK